MLVSVFAWSVNLQLVALPTLALAGCLGILALLSPRRFSRFSQCCSQWVDTAKFIEAFDKPIHIDQHVLRFSRVFGLVVIVACGVLAYVLYTHIL